MINMVINIMTMHVMNDNVEKRLCERLLSNTYPLETPLCALILRLQS